MTIDEETNEEAAEQIPTKEDFLFLLEDDLWEAADAELQRRYEKVDEHLANGGRIKDAKANGRKK